MPVSCAPDAVRRGVALAHLRDAGARMRTPWRVVLTGGPGGGKTTQVGALAATLREALGWRVYIVPEVPTVVWTSGVARADFSPAHHDAFRAALVELEVAHHRAWQRFAALAMAGDGQMTCVLADRGLLDEQPYCASAAAHETALRATGLSVAEALGMADVVLHLETQAAADPARYLADRAVYRTEAVAEALAADRATAAAWASHPAFHFLPAHPWGPDPSASQQAETTRLLATLATSLEGAPG